MADRRPSYLSCASLAHELEVSESTVYEMVRRGVLPKPIKLSAGCARWSWAEVERAIGSLAGQVDLSVEADDPFLAGVRNVAAPRA